MLCKQQHIILLQEDGTWTDIPRCIEHDPGVEEQVPGLCPSIPGYCAQGFLNTRCTFDCRTGPDINSICTQDGTWAPYPTCDGDLRETRDGCDGCPGPSGGLRNRTAEAILGKNAISDRRVPKLIAGDGGRKTVPSFAGNINIGRVSSRPENRFRNQRPRPGQSSGVRNKNVQTSFSQRQFPNERSRKPQVQQRPQVPQIQQNQPRASQRPTFNGKSLQGNRNIQREQNRNEETKLTPSQQKIRDQILRRKQQEAQALADILEGKDDTEELPVIRPSPIQRLEPTVGRQPSGSNFGVFETVNLSGDSGRSEQPSPRQLPRQPQQNDDFFGVFQEVSLQ